MKMKNTINEMSHPLALSCPSYLHMNETSLVSITEVPNEIKETKHKKKRMQQQHQKKKMQQLIIINRC
jgi:hypothetical protein